MPKTKTSKSSKLKQIVSEHGNIFKTDGTVLFCKVCDKAIVAEKKSQVDQHLGSAKHLALSKRQIEKATSSAFIESFDSRKSKFNEDLCEAFAASNIPFAKLKCQPLRNFLEKYTEHTIPHESTIRKGYVHDLANKKRTEVKNILSNQMLWISIDETTDSKNRYIANVVVGILSTDAELSKKSFLLNTEQLEKANHSTVARLFDNSVRLLGSDFNKDNILLFVSDAAPYMVKAGKAIKVFYPKLFHLTCMAHGIHRVAEKVRSLFPDVDNFVANGKKIFVKAAARVDLFQQIAPNTPLPPQPIVTRWGTWIEAVIYYSEHLDKFEEVLEHLKSEDSLAIATCKTLVQQQSLKNNIAFIAANYGHIPIAISCLERKGQSLSESIKVVTDCEANISAVVGSIAAQIKTKLKETLDKNPGLKQIRTISSILQGVSDGETQFTAAEISKFKYAPITSVDVERTFSVYKSLLADNRQRLTMDNLSDLFFIYCNFSSCGESDENSTVELE